MVLGDHIDEDNFSPDKDRLLRGFYGKSLLQPNFKPAALRASNTNVHVEALEIFWNIKIGGSTPLKKIVFPEKTGIICDKVVENTSDIRPAPVSRPKTSYVRIAQSNTIQSCQRTEQLFTEEKEKVQVQSEKRKSTVVVVEENEQEEDIKTVSIRCSSKEDSKENFKQGKPALTLVDEKKTVADKDEDEGQKTVGKRSISKADSREQIPREKLALTRDKGKFMDFIIFMRGLILVVFANYKKLKSKAFTWMSWVLSFILSPTKKSKNNSHWMVCWILVVCALFGNITAMALKGKVFVSLEDTNSIKIVATPGESTEGTPKWTTKIDGEIKLAIFNGIVTPEFQDKIHIVNRTTIHIANLSSKEWRSYWTYQKGFDSPIQTKQLSEYVDPVCADNLTVVGSSTTSITVMWNSGLDRGYHIITVLQYRSDGSSDWMSAYNTTEHTNQEVNFSIPDLKQGTSYDIRVLTLGENGSRLICESNLLTEKSQLEEQKPQLKPDNTMRMELLILAGISVPLSVAIFSAILFWLTIRYRKYRWNIVKEEAASNGQNIDLMVNYKTNGKKMVEDV